jgi:putative photosynthetic complex assembly protein
MQMSGAFMRNGSLPRGMVFGTALVLLGTFFLTTLGHQAPVNPAAAGALPAATRDLRFTDRADGAVVVTDARDGRQIEVVEPGTEGFVRGAMRGLVRQRRLAEIGPDQPFRLSAWPDGRITLQDTANGNTMELHAFGRSNVEAFLRLLTTEE